jgi:hypothetical protein
MRVTHLTAAALLAAAAAAWAADPHDINQIRTALAHRDFAVREAAQRELDELPLERRSELRTLADAETDPEVKSRLDARVAAIDVHLALHPPPISLDVKNATLGDVVAALNAALGGPFLEAPPQDPGLAFTLKADRQSFWEVMQKLSAQHRLDWKQAGPPGGATYWLFAAREGLANFTPGESLGVTVGMGDAAPGGARSMRVTFHADPRLKVVGVAPWFTVESAVDDTGRPVAVESQPALRLEYSTRSLLSTWTGGIMLPAPPAGRKLALVRGSARIAVITREARRVVTLSAEGAERPIDLPAGTVSLKSLAISPGGLGINMILERVNRDFESEVDAIKATVRIRVRDADGRVRGAFTPEDGFSELFARVPDGLRGVTLEATCATEVRELTIPITLENLPAPGAAAVPPAPTPR